MYIKKYKNLSEDEKILIANISHDLKSPTNAQINILDLLLNGQFGKLNPEQYQILEMTRWTSKYISNLVGTIISSYKSECNALQLNKTIFNLADVVENICKENKYIAKEKNLSIVFNNENKCLIYADKLQISRVINNFLTNALNYSLKDSLIIIEIIQNESFTEFTMSNKGYPIQKDELKNLFKKFHKTKNSKYNVTSTGLGLYSAKKIIDLHKGFIFANCTKDGIYTFGFKLALKRKTKTLIKIR